MSPTATRMTVREFLELPDDGNRYELIDGELILNASPVLGHQRIVRRLMVRLDRYFEDHGGGEVFVAPTDVILGDDNAVQPDLLVVTSSRASILSGEKNVQGAPDIAIEVLSSGTRRKDEVVKRKLYERFGVAEYWIVDHELELVKIYRANGGTFGQATEITAEENGAITSPLLPGFSMPVAKIFA